MTAAETQERHSDRFVRQVSAQCRRDRGRRAALRRGLRRPPEQAPTMHAVVAPLLPPTVTGDHEYAYYAVAAMIAASVRDGQSTGPAEDDDSDDGGEGVAAATGASPDDGPRPARPNLGTSLAWAVCRPGRGRRPMSAATAEKRLHLLVRQGYPAVHQQLAGVVRHLDVIDVPVNWAQLIDDLCEWRRHRDRVAKRWLQSYYRTLHNAERRAAQSNPSLEEPA
ncbi:type I-E CRISPR-associated protein Cse2/CasB [Micromonospora echinospora]|uniref:type I-E CRISPR-associated protein Cse2/CasB n=1 Tax=Micromonospora echinospora TaxID=1877 RepID=UPI003672AEF4